MTAYVSMIVIPSVVIVAGVLVPVLFLAWRRRSGLGRRPDGSWEDGRRVRDMTLGGKSALVIMFVALVAVLVVVVTDAPLPWLWGGFAVVLLAGATGIASERRRMRREGIDPLTYS